MSPRAINLRSCANNAPKPARWRPRLRNLSDTGNDFRDSSLKRYQQTSKVSSPEQGARKNEGYGWILRYERSHRVSGSAFGESGLRIRGPGRRAFILILWRVLYGCFVRWEHGSRGEQKFQ